MSVDEKRKPMPVPPEPQPEPDPSRYQKEKQWTSLVGALKSYARAAVFGETVDERITASRSLLSVGSQQLPEDDGLRSEIINVLASEATPIVPRITYNKSDHTYEVTGDFASHAVSVARPEELTLVSDRMLFAAREARQARMSVFVQALIARLVEMNILQRTEEW